jgi:2-C-methyl-D-erythritol 2,4-cyclodiphosphate synthase
MADKIRIGIGYDVHPLVVGRQLVIGGVSIAYPEGLDGWSDADVLLHAVMDALLGAAALGDIGRHFPPGDPQYQGVSSLALLAEVREKLAKNGWRTGNIDATILAEKPKLKDYMEEMRRNISRTLGIDIAQVNIKATTTEKLGFVGREEGMAAEAVALLESIN